MSSSPNQCLCELEEDEILFLSLYIWNSWGTTKHLKGITNRGTIIPKRWLKIFRGKCRKTDFFSLTTCQMWIHQWLNVLSYLDKSCSYRQMSWLMIISWNINKPPTIKGIESPVTTSSLVVVAVVLAVAAHGSDLQQWLGSKNRFKSLDSWLIKVAFRGWAGALLKGA